MLLEVWAATETCHYPHPELVEGRG